MDEFTNGKNTSSEPKYRPNRVSAFSHLLVGIGVFVFCASVFGLLGALAFGISIKDITDGVDVMSQFADRPIALKVFVFFSSSLPLIVSVIVVSYLIKANAKDYLLLHRPNLNLFLLLSLAFVFFGLPLMAPLLELNKLVDLSQWPALNDWLNAQDTANNKAYEAMIGERNTLSFLTSVLFMAFLPALAEELFFRGFLLNVCNGLFKSMHVAIIVTSLIFSAIHLQVLKFLPMFFLAATFAYAVYWTGSIWTSIIAHFINNLLAVVQLYFITDGDYTKAVNESVNLPIAVTVILTLLVAAIFYYNQTYSKNKVSNFYV
ncbi:MAG: hypothetical protein RLZZ337_463 [Bacteroidota bacterium]|jgi:membrane protease YdiL (CAAX protease family)